MFVIKSGDLNNAHLETKIIATPAKLTSTASITQEGFGVNLSVICVIGCRLVRVLLPGGEEVTLRRRVKTKLTSI